MHCGHEPRRSHMRSVHLVASSRRRGCRCSATAARKCWNRWREYPASSAVPAALRRLCRWISAGSNRFRSANRNPREKGPPAETRASTGSATPPRASRPSGGGSETGLSEARPRVFNRSRPFPRLGQRVRRQASHGFRRGCQSANRRCVMTKAHRVYCAGPLFNQSERDEMTAIANVCGTRDSPSICHTATAWNSALCTIAWCLEGGSRPWRRSSSTRRFSPSTCSNWWTNATVSCGTSMAAFPTRVRSPKRPSRGRWVSRWSPTRTMSVRSSRGGTTRCSWGWSTLKSSGRSPTSWQRCANRFRRTRGRVATTAAEGG